MLLSRTLLVAVSLLWALCSATGLEVYKIEPPGWWAAHSHNPVRLLVTGRDLSGILAKADSGLSISNLSANACGDYAFCDLFIAPTNAPGSRKIRFVRQGEEAVAEFLVLTPLPRSGRFGGFSTDDAIYLIMPDRFANGDPANDNPKTSPGLLNRSKPRDYHGGDFRGIIEKLPYLKDLGVTALWLTPWYDNVNHFNTREKYTRDNRRSADGIASTDYHGYGAVDFYNVEERFGDMTQLRLLVEAAHALGLKIIQDQVANHTSPYHPWVARPPTTTWFNGTEECHLDNNWEIWTTAQPDVPVDKLKSTIEGWFINILPDLNQNDPETAAYLIQNSLWWVGMTGVDAVRQDTLPYVPRSYWTKWSHALKREYPTITILGEVFNGDPRLVSFFQGGRNGFDGIDSGIDTLFDFPLHYAMRDVFAKNHPMRKLAETFAADSHYPNPEVLVTFLGLHDNGRFLSEPGATIESLKLAFTFLLTARGTPLIYYGDEIAMIGGGDPENRRDFPGGWKEDERNAFELSGRTPSENAVHGHVKNLLALRRELEPLRRGDFQIANSTEHTFAFTRATPALTVLVVINNDTTPQALHLTLSGSLATERQLFDRLDPSRPVPVCGGQLSLTLPPRSAMILTPETPMVAADGPKSTDSR